MKDRWQKTSASPTVPHVHHGGPRDGLIAADLFRSPEETVELD